MVRARSLFYRATDLYSDLKSDPGYSMCERLLVDKCHGLVATSEPVAEHLRQMAPDRPLLLLENGVDLEHFSRPRACPFEYAGIPEPRLVYLGAIDHRFDFDALPVAVQAGFQIVLIGPLSAGISPVLLQQPGVHWIGERAYEVAPAYLQHAQAGFLPMNQHPSNAGRSPMKLYEYGAAGLPVVARGTAELSRRQDSFVLLYASVEELAIRLSEARKRTRVTSNIIQGSSWTEKSARLLEFVRKFEGKA
jgi:glycosyltransferase involved in cell wall biosynthesis